MLGELREGENAGKKDIKLVGDYKRKRRQLDPFGPRDLGAMYGHLQTANEQKKDCIRLSLGVKRDLTNAKPFITRLAERKKRILDSV
jgi:hypothetical protein